MKIKTSCLLSGLLLTLPAPLVLAVEVQLPLPPAADFTSSISNGYWPLALGQAFRYIAETEDGCEYNKITVIRDTDSVMGYPVLTVRDQAWVHEPEGDADCDPAQAVLEEDTLDYYAQDSAGNVWYFGEDTLSYDDEGQCSDEGSWLAGDAAEPGLLMLAMPEAGMRYRQEFKEDEAEDWGAVKGTHAEVHIALGDYSNCLVIKEWTPLDPGSVEHKYYCPEPGNPGPGLVYIEELHGKTVKVEYVGMGDFGIPGEFADFPALVCPAPSSHF